MNPKLLSGEFTGFYAYNHLEKNDYKMHCSLVFFEDGRIIGHGIDDINPFHFEGHVSNGQIIMHKKYPSHELEYLGTIEENTNSIAISGIWSEKGPAQNCGVFTLRKGHSKASVMSDINHLEEVIKSQLRIVEH